MMETDLRSKGSLSRYCSAAFKQCPLNLRAALTRPQNSVFLALYILADSRTL